MDTRAFHKLSYGLYVIGSTREGQLNGQVANTVFQISSDPATVAISINKKNLTNEYIKFSGVFSVSVLSKDTPLDFIGHFGFKSGRDIDKYKNISYKLGLNGVPVLTEHAVSVIEAEVIASYDVETHTLFIGKVVNAEVPDSGEPMTYAYYHQVKRGLVPDTAPAQVKEESPGHSDLKGTGDDKAKKYVCTICGYIYDPAAGDPDSGIAPGTAFEDIPDDWVCPVCGVGKDQFEVVE